MLQLGKKIFLGKMRNLKSGVIGVIFCSSMLVTCDSYARGFYVYDLEREYYEERVVPPSPRPRPRKVYVYHEPPPQQEPQEVYVYHEPMPRPKPKKVYVYREPPPRPKPKQVYVYEDSTTIVRSKSPQRYNYRGPGFLSQNNFLMLKLGGSSINRFGRNSEITAPVKSFIVGVGLGHQFNDYINGSVELDVFSEAKGHWFDRNDSKGISVRWDLSSSMVTVNTAISLFPGQPVDFYVKAGIGMSNNKSGTYTWANGMAYMYYNGASNYNLAWKGGFGIKVNTLSDIDTSLEYMLTSRGTFRTQDMRRVDNQDYPAVPKEAKFYDQTLSIVLSKKIS